jgi:hypothetical protein
VYLPKVYLETKPLYVYRAYAAGSSFEPFGNWWTFDRPRAPKEAFRRANEICPTWNPLVVYHRCFLKIVVKVVVKVVVGTGQSAA